MGQEVLGIFEVWQVVLGTMVLTTGALVTVIAWLAKRVRAVSMDVAGEVMAPHEATVGRVQRVEERLAAVADDMHSLRSDHAAIGRRMSRLETTIETVARKDDLAEIAREMSEFRGAATAEIRQIGGMTHSIHQAILRANRGPGT